MRVLISEPDAGLYELDPCGQVERLILTTPETRAICNDPFVFGTEYTDRLRQSMSHLFTALKRTDRVIGTETNTVVLNILRGGLNFGLRDALAAAYNWKRHRSAFISSQRAQDDTGGFHITEDKYQKFPRARNAELVFGDVVATGVSLKHALLKLVELSRQNECAIRRLTFVTIGGARAEQLLFEADVRCRQVFPDYRGARVVYVEGVFGVAEEGSPLQIALPGTDLLRHPAVLAPEFIASQAEQPSYPLERCAIYDAGSRAYDVEEYLHDVSGYWEKVRKLARSGTSYEAYLRERFPIDPQLEQGLFPSRWKEPEYLAHIALRQIDRSRKILED